MMRPIRNSVKALIVRNNQLLVIRLFRDEEFFTLPGGGQEPGEDMKTALHRECREEIGCEVEIGDLVYVRDYIAKNHEFADEDPHFHLVELMFECSLPEGEEPRMTEEKDTYQTGIEWIPLDRLSEYKIYPKVFQKLLLEDKAITYMGDVN